MLNNLDWDSPVVWEKLKLNKVDAEKKFYLLESNIEPKLLNEYSKQIREKLFESLKSAQVSTEEETSAPSKYAIDLNTGLLLYETLNNEFKFNERLAAQDDIWRYLSIYILPDVVYNRHGLKPDNYYKHPRRIWLKSIWWYIHLSWQGNVEETYVILENNTTDSILQMVDRTGLNGYRVNFTRELMYQFYVNYNSLSKTEKTSLFRRVHKLSTARTKVLEPSFVDDGVQSYVRGLFEYFTKTEANIK